MVAVEKSKIRELEQYIKDEILEAQERGCESENIKEIEAHFEDLKTNTAPDRWRYYETILDILSNLGIRDDFPYNEPSDFNEILASAVKAPLLTAPKISDDELKDKIYGAWLGRCAGCMLGKPVEGRGRRYIRRLLEAAGKYPLDGYFPDVKQLPEECKDFNPDQRTIRGNITCAVRDDDTDYPIINLHIVKKFSLDFTSANVAEGWLDRFPFNMVYTAERVAYRNFVNGIMPPESASYRNPYREWIGAQIRADFWGYINPGLIKRAAEFAFRDASISHTANGIYGEIFFAAVIAASFITGDIELIIKTGLSVVPSKSRFAEMVDDVLKIRRQDGTWESAIETMMAKYEHYHCIHTINNAGIVLLALLYGDGDFGKTISMAVMGGEDTDCNGATAGSIIGAMLGKKHFPHDWSDCLNDTVESAVIGYNNSKISDLAGQTYKLAKQNIQNI